MNARVAKEEMAILLPDSMSHYVRGDMTPQVDAGRRGLVARIRAALRWIIEMPKRRSVLDELSMLSDYELADIGLSRSELPRVFDPAFAAEREAQCAIGGYVRRVPA
jgi:uncharacterized protein YjiS (DUF1127 family)